MRRKRLLESSARVRRGRKFCCWEILTVFLDGTETSESMDVLDGTDAPTPCPSLLLVDHDAPLPPSPARNRTAACRRRNRHVVLPTPAPTFAPTSDFPRRPKHVARERTDLPLAAPVLLSLALLLVVPIKQLIESHTLERTRASGHGRRDEDGRRERALARGGCKEEWGRRSDDLNRDWD